MAEEEHVNSDSVNTTISLSMEITALKELDSLAEMEMRTRSNMVKCIILDFIRRKRDEAKTSH